MGGEKIRYFIPSKLSTTHNSLFFFRVGTSNKRVKRIEPRPINLQKQFNLISDHLFNSHYQESMSLLELKLTKNCSCHTVNLISRFFFFFFVCFATTKNEFTLYDRHMPYAFELQTTNVLSIRLLSSTSWFSLTK